jgi:hypothetical protein
VETVRDTIVGKEKEHRLLEGSQASPSRPDKSRVNVKALGWLEAVA